jgi:hypothetical protein
MYDHQLGTFIQAADAGSFSKVAGPQSVPHGSFFVFAGLA